MWTLNRLTHTGAPTLPLSQGNLLQVNLLHGNLPAM